MRNNSWLRVAIGYKDVFHQLLYIQFKNILSYMTNIPKAPWIPPKFSLR